MFTLGVGVLTKSRLSWTVDKDLAYSLFTQKKETAGQAARRKGKKKTAVTCCCCTGNWKRKAHQLVPFAQYQVIFKRGQSCRWAVSSPFYYFSKYKFNYSNPSNNIFIDWFWLSSGRFIRGNFNERERARTTTTKWNRMNWSAGSRVRQRFDDWKTITRNKEKARGQQWPATAAVVVGCWTCLSTIEVRE